MGIESPFVAERGRAEEDGGGDAGRGRMTVGANET